MLILVVDDDAVLRHALSEFLKKDFNVLTCGDGAEAIAILKEKLVDVVITDYEIPKLSGLDVIRQGKEIAPSTYFLLMTAHGSIQHAVNAIHIGADDYLVKPFDFSEIERRLRRIDELTLWKSEGASKKESAQGVNRLVGNSLVMQESREFVRKASKSPSPVLLLGATGTGKEVVARAIHETGPHVMRPFIPISCANLPEPLLESELFGHEKGAFKGAVDVRVGKFELARGGTLFLDELADIPQPIQAKLVRVLETKEFFRVGGDRLIKSQARVIAATNRSLTELVKTGKFREDLFSQLNGLSFEIVPLKEHKEDIPALIEHFWQKLGREFGKAPTLAPETMRALKDYFYPGNVLELKNALERLMVLGTGNEPVGVHLLPREFLDQESKPKVDGYSAEFESLLQKGLKSVLEEYEYKKILEALAATNGNRSATAKILELAPSELSKKLKKYGYNNQLKQAA